MKTRVRVNYQKLAEIFQKKERRIATPNLDTIQIGDPFGLYGEAIERVEISKSIDKIPRWFDPRSSNGHIAIHSQDGRCAYIALTVNKDKRASVHPFDHIISANAVHKAEQLRLL